jgi:hypothetical protein
MPTMSGPRPARRTKRGTRVAPTVKGKPPITPNKKPKSSKAPKRGNGAY